jgi:hypothetical protein
MIYQGHATGALEHEGNDREADHALVWLLLYTIRDVEQEQEHERLSLLAKLGQKCQLARLLAKNAAQNFAGR